MTYYLDTGAFLKLVVTEREKTKLLTWASEVSAEFFASDPGILRSLGALHLATALALAEDLEGIVTYDVRLADAAALHGVPVLAPR